MGFQFIHLETYSRKSDKHGRSVGYVLDEASREPHASLHVETPLPPELVYGIPLHELRALHDERVADALVTNAVGKTKKLRVDQHTLATIIVSHPGGESDDVARWEALTVAWLKDTYGGDLTTVVRHVDEGHPHLHAYVLPSSHDMKARAFHPGVQAKTIASQAALDAGDDAKTSNKKGDRAYREAMRGWQDAYFAGAGLDAGLTRLGPGGRRLSGAEWQAEKKQVQVAAALAERVAQLEASASRAEVAVGRGQAKISSLHNEVAQAKAERDLAIQAAELAKESADLVVAEARKQADGMVAKARRQATRILGQARKEASRLKGVGAVLGGFVQGILGASPSRVADLVRAEEQGKAVEQVNAVRVELKEVRGELRASEKARSELVATVREVATERDDLRAKVPAGNQTLARSEKPTV